MGLYRQKQWRSLEGWLGEVMAPLENFSGKFENFGGVKKIYFGRNNIYVPTYVLVHIYCVCIVSNGLGHKLLIYIIHVS